MPELIPDEENAETLASARTLKYLEALDDSFVEQALQLGVRTGSVLDMGTGSGQVPIKLALHSKEFIVHGIDLSNAMLRRAAMEADRWRVGLRVLFNYCDATSTLYDAGLFDLVLCNAVLHRVPNPVALIREMSRVCKPGGALLLRDYRRPNHLLRKLHMRRYGDAYEGRMREIFEAALRSSFTLEELRNLVREAGVNGVQVSRMGPLHIGFQGQNFTRQW